MNELNLEQIAAAWLRLWFLLEAAGGPLEEMEESPYLHKSRTSGPALRRVVETTKGDAAVFTFTCAHGAGGPDDAPGHVLGYQVVVLGRDDDEDQPALAAEIDIRDDWVRGTIVALNQGRWLYTKEVTRLLDPWQRILDTFTSGIADIQRYLLERDEREAAARAVAP